MLFSGYIIFKSLLVVKYCKKNFLVQLLLFSYLVGYLHNFLLWILNHNIFLYTLCVL